MWTRMPPGQVFFPTVIQFAAMSLVGWPLSSQNKGTPDHSQCICYSLVSGLARRATHLSSPSLQWRHNDYDGVSNPQPHSCLLNRLFRRRSKKTSKHRVTGLCVGNSPGPANSPLKGPVTRKMFPFDDVIMFSTCYACVNPIIIDLIDVKDCDFVKIKAV